MANEGYNIGIARQPIDFVSGAMAFNQAAADERLKEIEENREQVSENYKNILKASSINLLPELTDKIRDKYQVEIEDYRNNIMEKFKESGGKLSMKQQREVQDGFGKLQQDMLYSVGGLKKIDEAQKILNDPRSQNVYDTSKLGQVIASARERVMTGGDVGSLTSDMSQAMLPQSNVDYLYKRYGKAIEGLNLNTVGRWKDDNTFAFTTSEDEAEFDRRIDTWMQDPNIRNQYTDVSGGVDAEKYDAIKEELKDGVIKTIKKEEPKRKYDASGGLSKKQELYPTTITTHRGEEDWYNVPKGVPQPTGKMQIKDAYDSETGRKVTLNRTTPYAVVGFSPSSGRIAIETGGGVILQGGKPLLHDPNKSKLSESDSVADKKKAAKTSDKIKSNALSLLGKISSTGDAEKWTRVTNVKMDENDDGTWTLSGNLEQHKKAYRIGTKIRTKAEQEGKDPNLVKEEYQEIHFNPITDDREKRTLELDLDEYRGAISPIEKGWRIGNETVSDMIDRTRGERESGGKGYDKGTEAKIAAFMKANKLGRKEAIKVLKENKLI